MQGRDILARSQDLLDLGNAYSEHMNGQVRLGCIPTIAPFLLSDLVQQVNHRFPKLNLLLKEDTTAQLLQALRHGELDVLILAMPVDIGSMESCIVGQDPFRMVMRKDRAQDMKAPLQYEDLPDQSVFLLEQEHCLTGHAVSACQLTQKDKINPFSATSLHTLVQMVANGLGCTFIPQMAIDHGLLDNLNLAVIEPQGNASYREIGLVWRPSSNRTETFRILAQVVEEILQFKS